MSFSSPNGPVPEFRDADQTQQAADLARMLSVPAVPLQPRPAPGWYPEPGKPGVLRYWNGASWEDWRKPLVDAPSVSQGQKSMAVAYVLALFFGGLGIHNFYLGRIGPAVGMLVLWLLGVITAAFFIGGFLLLGVLIWLIVDLCLIPSYVRASALRAVGHAA